MANCYYCNRSGATFRRNVSTGSSFGSWGSSRSVGSSSRTYYGLRTVCEPCAARIDKRALIGKSVFWFLVASVLVYFFFVR